MALGHIALAVPLVTWILIGTFDSIEPELEHAARIDGATARRRCAGCAAGHGAEHRDGRRLRVVLSWNDLLISKVLTSDAHQCSPGIVNLWIPSIGSSPSCQWLASSLRSPSSPCLC